MSMTAAQFVSWLKDHSQRNPGSISEEVSAELSGVRIEPVYVYAGNENQRYTLQEALELGIIERGR